ncbi:hypothetical protein EM595_p0279 (plasmid) [Duffyella gerundensis]|uniref:Uncharacterized protein n=1 Tax=Duffyella gerundensis TaxID=1619313 RepID=A0A0U5L586_9GAMM|nr:hypothetical protein EM595_p0279 [Duffyella gerundensis]
MRRGAFPAGKMRKWFLFAQSVNSVTRQVHEQSGNAACVGR